MLNTSMSVFDALFYCDAKPCFMLNRVFFSLLILLNKYLIKAVIANSNYFYIHIHIPSHVVFVELSNDLSTDWSSLLPY